MVVDGFIVGPSTGALDGFTTPVSVCMSGFCVHLCVHICKFVNACVCMCVCVCVHMYVCMYVCVQHTIRLDYAHVACGQGGCEEGGCGQGG